MLYQLNAAETLLGGVVLAGMFAICYAAVCCARYVKLWLERKLPPLPSPPPREEVKPLPAAEPEKVYYLLDKAPRPKPKRAPQKMQARRIYFSDEKEG